MALEAPQKAVGGPGSDAKMKAVGYSIIFGSPLVGHLTHIYSDRRLFSMNEGREMEGCPAPEHVTPVGCNARDDEQPPEDPPIKGRKEKE